MNHTTRNRARSNTSKFARLAAWLAIAFVAATAMADVKTDTNECARAVAAEYKAYAQKVIAAKRQYAQNLTRDRNIAVKNGNLKEANAADAALNQANAEIAELTKTMSLPAAAPEPGIVVARASVGAKSQWTDVTRAVQAHDKNGVLSTTTVWSELAPQMPDPDFGHYKYLVLGGTINGLPFSLVVSDSKLEIYTGPAALAVPNPSDQPAATP